jgi:putative phosphoesterase
MLTRATRTPYLLGERPQQNETVTPDPTLRLVLTADTHLPNRARDLPDELWTAIADADVVLHAGDWVDVSLLDALESLAKRVIGVYGNNDGPDLRARLDEVVHVELAGVRFAMVHETGPASGREKRCAVSFPEVDVLVFGHSHIPWDTTAANGLRLLNPGSPTDRRRQPYCTYMTAVASAGALREVTLHRLPLRRTTPTMRHDPGTGGG